MDAPPRQIAPVRVVVALLLTAGLLAAITAFVHPQRPDWSRPTIPQIDVNTALSWQPAPLWVDARTRSEFAREHIPGAVSFAIDAPWEKNFVALIGQWSPPQKVIVYCGGGNCASSRDVAEKLRRELGSNDVFVLRGGWAGWNARSP